MVMAMSLPISWTSPRTVPSTITPTFFEAAFDASSAGCTTSTALCMARAASISSGRKISPVPKRSPTARMATDRVSTNPVGSAPSSRAARAFSPARAASPFSMAWTSSSTVLIAPLLSLGYARRLRPPAPGPGAVGRRGPDFNAACGFLRRTAGRSRQPSVRTVIMGRSMPDSLAFSIASG